MERAAIWYTSDAEAEFSHVELNFPRFKGRGGRPYSCGVCAGETVHFDTKGFGRPGYGYIDINVTSQQEAKMKTYCQKLARNSVPFNRAGQFFNFICPGCNIGSGGDSFFCSQLVVEILQHGGVLEKNIISWKTSPNNLWRIANRLPGSYMSSNPAHDSFYGR